MSPILILLIGVIAVAAALGVWASTGARRRRQVIDRAREQSGDASASTMRVPLLRDESSRAERLQEAVEGVLPEGLVAETKGDRLVRAGFDSPAAPAIYAALRVLGAVAIPGVVIAFAPRDDELLFATFIIAGVALGLMLPPYLLLQLEKGRQRRILNSIPDCLDLLLVCVEAGVSLDAALLRVGREMKLLHPELAEELLVVNRRTNAGLRRDQALHGLFVRTGVDQLRTLGSAMIQSEKWGSSIGRVLRVYSETLRRQRRHAAERKAATAATKMVFPMVLFILPALFAIIGGPMVIGLGPIWQALGF